MYLRFMAFLFRFGVNLRFLYYFCRFYSLGGWKAVYMLLMFVSGDWSEKEFKDAIKGSFRGKVDKKEDEMYKKKADKQMKALLKVMDKKHVKSYVS